MSHDTHLIRPSVLALAAISPVLKAALVLVLLLPAVLPVQRPNPSILVALVAGVMTLAVVRGALAQRLSQTELAVVQYWSLTPMLILLLAGALGTLPALLLSRLASHSGWSEAVIHSLAKAVLVGSLLSGAIVVWALWKRFRASLAGPGNKRASAA